MNEPVDWRRGSFNQKVPPRTSPTEQRPRSAPRDPAIGHSPRWSVVWFSQGRDRRQVFASLLRLPRAIFQGSRRAMPHRHLPVAVRVDSTVRAIRRRTCCVRRCSTASKRRAMPPCELRFRVDTATASVAKGLRCSSSDMSRTVLPGGAEGGDDRRGLVCHVT